MESLPFTLTLPLTLMLPAAVTAPRKLRAGVFRRNSPSEATARAVLETVSARLRLRDRPEKGSRQARHEARSRSHRPDRYRLFVSVSPVTIDVFLV